MRRGGHGKSAMSRVTHELEVFAEDSVPFDSCVSDNSHMKILFNYEAVLRVFCCLWVYWGKKREVRYLFFYLGFYRSLRYN